MPTRAIIWPLLSRDEAEQRQLQKVDEVVGRRRRSRHEEALRKDSRDPGKCRAGPRLHGQVSDQSFPQWAERQLQVNVMEGRTGSGAAGLASWSPACLVLEDGQPIERCPELADKQWTKVATPPAVHPGDHLRASGPAPQDHPIAPPRRPP